MKTPLTCFPLLLAATPSCLVTGTQKQAEFAGAESSEEEGSASAPWSSQGSEMEQSWSHLGEPFLQINTIYVNTLYIYLATRIFRNVPNQWGRENISVP